MTNTPIDLHTDPRIAEQIAANPVEATLTQIDGQWTLLMQRRLRHSPDRIWSMLTDPAMLARWSPVVPDHPLDTVGPATSRENAGSAPVDTTVLTAERPRELVHRWGADTLRWTLEAADGGTVLTLRHTFADRGSSPSFGAGWHICLGTLAALDAFGPDRLSDSDAPTRVVGGVSVDYGWQRLHDAYAEAL